MGARDAEVARKECYIPPPISFAPLSTMAHFKGKKSRFFLNIILERKLTAPLGEKRKNMFKIIKISSNKFFNLKPLPSA